jgi:hypothetical protein
MPQQRLDIDDRQAVLHTDGGLRRTTRELAESETFAPGISVGQLRTRLGIDGLATHGPHEAAAALLDLIAASPAEKGDPRR